MVIQTTILKHKRQNDFTTDQEVAILWKYAKEFSVEMPIIIGHAMFRGMRNGEIASINLYDYKGSDFDQMRIVLEKSHIEDTFPILKEFSIMIKEYVKNNMHRFRNGWIFPSSKVGKPITPNTIDIYFGRLRSRIGKDHPEFLDHRTYRPSHWILCRMINDGIKDINELKERSGVHKETIRKALTRLFELGLIDLEMELTKKGQAYIQKDLYVVRHRITLHTLRRWFETKLHDKYKDSYLIRDVMRYHDVKTVNHYIDSYKTWMREKEIMKETFENIYREFQLQEKGQSKLNQYSIL